MIWTLIAIGLTVIGGGLLALTAGSWNFCERKLHKIFNKYQKQIDEEIRNDHPDWDKIGKFRAACGKEQSEFRQTKLYRFSDCLFDKEGLDALSHFSFVLGVIGLIICGFIIIITHTGVDAQIRSNQIEYESLCDRLEIVNSDYEDISKSDVIKDVADWNDRVNRALYWSQNPWTSWFYSQREVAELKFIEYGGKK